MASLARAARKANLEFFNAGLRYAELTRIQNAAQASTQAPSTSHHVVPVDIQALNAEQHEAEVAWRVARKNMHIAFSNFAAAFYRMMDEPIKRQANVQIGRASCRERVCPYVSISVVAVS